MSKVNVSVIEAPKPEVKETWPQVYRGNKGYWVFPSPSDGVFFQIHSGKLSTAVVSREKVKSDYPLIKATIDITITEEDGA